MTKPCKEYKTFRERNEATKKTMIQAMAAIQREGYFSSGRSSPIVQFQGSTDSGTSEWKTVDNGNKRKRTVGRPTAIARAGDDPLQSRLPHMRPRAPSTDMEDITMSTQ
jgi:hypothetical protein